MSLQGNPPDVTWPSQVVQSLGIMVFLLVDWEGDFQEGLEVTVMSCFLMSMVPFWVA